MTKEAAQGQTTVLAAEKSHEELTGIRARAIEPLTDKETDGIAGNQGVCDLFLTKMGLPNPTFNQAILYHILEQTHLGKLYQQLNIDDNNPKNFKTLLQRLKNGIECKHPPIAAALRLALDEGVFDDGGDGDLAEQCLWSLHHMWLMDAVGCAMQNDLNAMKMATAFIKERCEEMGVRQGNVFKTLYDTVDPKVKAVLTHPWRLVTNYSATETIKNWLFGAAKITTIYQAMEMQEAVREAGAFTPEQVLARRKGLAFNILEAILADFVAGNANNAQAGVVLMQAWSHGMDMRGGKIIYEVSDDWASLYQCWNLAFILGNLPNMDFMPGKLLAPMVSDVPGDEYLSGRTILLYLSIFLCLQRLKNGSVVEIHPIQLRLAEILGQETKAFAEKYCQSNDYKTAVAESLPTIYERAVARMVGNPVGKDNA